MSHDARKPSIPATPLVVLLMVLITALVIAMAWQARRAQDAHAETAINVLGDYAGLAADEFSRRAMAAIGYSGYFQFVGRLKNDLDAANANDSPALYIFELAPGADRPVVVSGSDEHLSPEVTEYISATLPGYLSEPMPDAGFAVHHGIVGSRQHSFVFYWQTESGEVTGFEAHRQWQEDVLRQVLDEGPLLPDTLADGAVDNASISLRLEDASGAALFATGGNLHPATSAVRNLADEYNGVLRQHRLTISIDPSLAESLIIGGLPTSQTPLFVAIILLAAGLLLATLRQQQKEVALTRARTNFVAEVSHELRTPLTQIRMFAESLQLGRLADGDRERALSIINRESRRLIQIVENILRHTSSSNGGSSPVLESQNVAAIVTTVVDDFEPLAEARDVHVRLALDEATCARCEPDALRQVLLNLLDNAVKYGPDGQVVDIGVTQDDGDAVITVSDAGPGIPESDREVIWNEYHRLDRERHSAIAGTGIGLSVVKSLVEAQGGSVGIASSPAGGASFEIRLPT